MKCLTICQPYAHLIVTPQFNLPAGVIQKRVENRQCGTEYRGPLLIHAGMSRQYWTNADQQLYGGCAWGAIVGRCKLLDCVHLINAMAVRSALLQFPWFNRHPHVEGPVCFLLGDVQRLKKPIPLRGKQGLFEVDAQLLEGAVYG